MTTNITEPLRLAVGSHMKGSGYGCAMNVIAWETGDPDISDLPACADKFLARMIHGVNDSLCTHTESKTYIIDEHDGRVVEREAKLLCPACSMKALDLAHRTMGTSIDNALDVWLQIYSERLTTNIRHWSRLRPQKDRKAKIAMAQEIIKACQVIIEDKDQASWHNTIKSAQEQVWKVREAINEVYGSKTPNEVFEMACCFDTFIDDEFDVDFLFARDNQGKVLAHRLLLPQAHQIIDRFEDIAGLKAPEMDFEAVERAFLEMSKVNA